MTANIPADDPTRKLTVVNAEDPALPHIGMVGDTYTLLVSGADTAGRYCLFDMLIPAGGGPPPHRHDFEEMFTLLEGELEFTFRGETVRAKAGMTVNVPANAPHRFQNVSDKPARMLCMASPAGLEDFFHQVGVPLATRTTPAPIPSPEEMAKKGPLMAELAAQYRTEMLG